MTITIKEKITEALENYRDAAEPLELFRALGLNDKDQFAAAVQELEQEGRHEKGKITVCKKRGAHACSDDFPIQGVFLCPPAGRRRGYLCCSGGPKAGHAWRYGAAERHPGRRQGAERKGGKDHPERKPPLYWNRSPPGPGLRTGIGWRFSLSGAG